MKHLVFFLLVFLNSLFVCAMQDTLIISECGVGGHPEFKLREEVCLNLLTEDYLSLSDSEKREIMLGILAADLFDIQYTQMFVNLWNEKLDADEIPNDLSYSLNVECRDESGKNCILDAWIGIAAIEDSFKTKEDYFIPRQGKVQVIYGYELSKPSDIGYAGSSKCGNPTTYNIDSYEGEACGFVFSNSDQSKNSLFVNEKREDQDAKLLTYTTSQIDNEIRTSLDIINQIDVDVYKWKGAGSCPCNCGKTGCSCPPKYECIYDSSYTYEETKKLHKIVNASLFPKQEESYSMRFTDKFTNPIVEFNTEIPGFRLHLGKAVLEKTRYRYAFNSSHPPYNYLVIERKDKQLTLASDLTVIEENSSHTKFKTGAENLNACILEIFSPYDHKTIVCNATLPDIFTPDVTLTTDQAVYKKGEEILLVIHVDDENYESKAIVTYGDSSRIAEITGDKTLLHLDAAANQTIIMVRYGGYNFSTQVQVYNPKRYSALGVFLFSIVLVILLFKAGAYSYLRRKI